MVRAENKWSKKETEEGLLLRSKSFSLLGGILTSASFLFGS
jgi:hypothetical protein